jgi:hypothetical protein
MFSFGLLVFECLNLRSTRFLRAGQMCFCLVKRKSQLKPANFFVAHRDLGFLAVNEAILYKRSDGEEHTVTAVKLTAM